MFLKTLSTFLRSCLNTSRARSDQGKIAHAEAIDSLIDRRKSSARTGISDFLTPLSGAAVFKQLLSRFSANAFPWHLLILLLCFSLLAGCSAVSTLQSSDDETELPIGSKKSAYNKPYKVKGKTYTPMLNASGYKARGMASWYGAESGNRTANGARFNPNGLTAAHKTLPIPSKVRVTNLRNGRHVDVVINDRGPFRTNRLIDLSQGAAEQIGMRGLTEVTVEYLDS